MLADPTDVQLRLLTTWLLLLLGDVNYVKVFSQPLVILNSFQAAKDLLERRGAIYSDRPRMVLLSEL